MNLRSCIVCECYARRTPRRRDRSLKIMSQASYEQSGLAAARRSEHDRVADNIERSSLRIIK